MSEHVSGEILPELTELPEVDSANWSAASVPAEGREPLVTGEIVLTLDPFSQEAADFIPRVRAEVDRLMAAALEVRGEPPGSGVAVVGGLAAETHDTAQAVSRDTWLVVPLALLLILLVLAVLLRAIVAPLYLVATAVLSFLFALGVGSLVFTHLMDQPGSDPSLTIFAFIFLVGFGVDYNVFLMGRIQEERRGGLATRPAVLTGLARTGGVITSAGLILAGTFSALMALTFEALFQFGFVIAVGLLVDTLFVRALLVPSIAYLLDERNWWPWKG